MRKLSIEQKKQLQAKIDNERVRRHEVAMEMTRRVDEADERLAFGYRSRGLNIGYYVIRPLVMGIPGLSYRGKLIVGVLATLVLPVIIIALILLILGR